MMMMMMRDTGWLGSLNQLVKKIKSDVTTFFCDLQRH